MSKRRLMIMAVVNGGRTHADVAAQYGVTRAWVTKLVSRYRAEGNAAFEPGSRRPHSSPTATPARTVELIIELRHELTGQGLDAGPATIGWHLEQRHHIVVSTSTIRRRLLAAGLIEPEPKKRPKSSFIRFEASLPNECWQTDMTHVRLADRTDVEVLSWLDDHARFALSVTAHRRVTTPVVTNTFTQTAQTHGFPASVLSDNGMYFTARFAGPGGGTNRFEQLLTDTGITQKHSRPNHPRTCGKVERFQQTLKKWLAAQPPPDTIDELQILLDTFVDIYNHQRPHRSLNRTTPAVAYHRLPKTGPGDPTTHQRIRHDRVDTCGKVTVRYHGRLHHIGIGRAHKGTPVIMLINDRDIRIINHDTGEIIRQLTLDPTRNYQPQTPPENQRTPRP